VIPTSARPKPHGDAKSSRARVIRVGERVRAVIVRVEKASKGPGVVVSRAAPMVQHLFQTKSPKL